MLELQHIKWKTPSGEEILKDVNIVFPDNKLVVITGPNGGGKTTIAKIISGIEKPTGGKILLNGNDITNKDITERARMGISFAFQQPIRFKGITVKDLLSLATEKPLSGGELSVLLHKVGLCAKDYLDREINSALSGGEIKRIEIATVLARNTPLAVFDEPEAGIDLWSFTNLIQTFTDLKNEKKATLVIISHQERILSIADEVIVLSGGKVEKQGPTEKILPDILSNTRGKYCCPKGREIN